ncbi:MAG: ZIP family metal transporter [Elusimicrobiota bacterium]|jgi:ZIP family zinc transporter/zinc and cadmium transporter|nr:ZIP family metal transporter [Elusimicrobiota bacterium]
MAIIYSIIAALSSLLGALLVLKFHTWSEKNSLFLINFAAGVMIALAFIHLIPEGAAINQDAPFYVLVGFMIMFFLQFILLFHPCHDGECIKHTDAFSTVGLSLHSFIDGLIIAVGFSANSQLGILTTLAILLHKLPDGITISAILVHLRHSKKKVLLISGITAAFTPIGAIIGILLFDSITQSLLGILLAITAGSFIFLSAADLIPQTHKSKNRKVPLMFFAGIGAILIIEIFFGID